MLEGMSYHAMPVCDLYIPKTDPMSVQLTLRNFKCFIKV